jgi:2-polyprenyl-6-hydroxyphenyl methylase/3-demethylubiquinone-9 3-methyltransferase
LSDIWNAPMHDFPIRDEVLYQYLPFSRDMDVLEIGPGNGFTAFRLARLVRSLMLVDIAAQNIANLQTLFRDFQRLTCVAADVCAPGLAERLGSQFDAVYGMEIFELLPDPGACLKNLAAVLRPNGRLLIQFPNYPPEHYALTKTPGQFYFKTREEFDRLLRAAGFQDWTISAVKLRPHARFLYRECHERPLDVYRTFRSRKGMDRPLAYDKSWAFEQRKKLESFKYLLHGAWSILFAMMRVGGDCFERIPLGDDILNHNLLLLARR